VAPTQVQVQWDATTDDILFPLFPQFDWLNWYVAESGYLPSQAFFGPYVIVPVGDVLYVGLGSARPAEMDGALLAQVDETVTAVSPLTEQGVHEMIWVTDTLHIAGSDPCCPDDWSAGNHYTYTPPGPLLKHRDAQNGLAHVLHTWGLWMDAGNVLYAAVSAEVTPLQYGRLMRSFDEGVTWELVSNVSNYRVYDVFRFDEMLYVLANDAHLMPLYLLRSPNDGSSWEVALAEPLQRIRIVNFAGQLLVVSFAQDALYALSGDDVTRYDLPAETHIGVSYTDEPQYSDYNLLAVYGDWLYAIWEVGGDRPLYYVVRTQDLLHWEGVAVTERPLIAITYWPQRETIVVGSSGTAANLWRPLRLNDKLYLPLIGKSS
ncbi:MAG: hypothetical protein KC443_05680, partial [Anaerolineales bacterium]|nr:hypothetical protein [Anaerolineales bacterium]